MRTFDPVQLNSIEQFCKAAELGSFTAAAEFLGLTPASVSRSWMNRNSSSCLRVSMSGVPPTDKSNGSKRPALKTNHERTLYVQCVFRNLLI